MATSGSYDYSTNRTAIIKRALKIMGVLEAGDEPSSEDYTDCAIALNGMIKQWMADGFKLWKIREATVFLTPGTASYSLGTSGSHASLSAVKTELGADAATSATSLTVDSIAGISASDTIGVVLNDGTIHWDTVSGSPSGTTVTLTTGLSGAASTDAHVYAYTTRLVRPLRVRSARRRDSAENDTPLLSWSRDEYFDTPNKTSQGTPTAIYYDPQLNSGVLYVWQAPNSANDRILIDVDVPIEDLDSATDEPDFPQEWYNALSWGLAFEMRLDYAVPVEIMARIEAGAPAYKDRLLGWDTEPESAYFVPNMG